MSDDKTNLTPQGMLDLLEVGVFQGINAQDMRDIVGSLNERIDNESGSIGFSGSSGVSGFSGSSGVSGFSGGSGVSGFSGGSFSPTGTLEVYVDRNRTDSFVADGTILRPYATIQAAIDGSPSGSVINIAGGTYAENLDVDKTLHFVGHDGGSRNNRVRIQSTSTVSDPLVHVQSTAANVSFSHLTIWNNTTSETSGNVSVFRYEGTSALRLFDCYFVDFGAYGSGLGEVTWLDLRDGSAHVRNCISFIGPTHSGDYRFMKSISAFNTLELLDFDIDFFSVSSSTEAVFYYRESGGASSTDRDVLSNVYNYGFVASTFTLFKNDSSREIRFSNFANTASVGTITFKDGTNPENIIAVNPLGHSDSGTYTGDGAATQSITGIGFRPRFLFVWEDPGVGLSSGSRFWTSDTFNILDPAGSAFDLNGGQHLTDRIVSLDADGFTVGDGGTDLNSTGVSYYYVAIG